MQSALLDEIKKLSVAERILLVEEIWDGIVDTDDSTLSMPDEQRIELDRRIEAYQNEPNSGRTWHEIQEEYRRSGR
jgi:putative addiction module component (TIGR02574 family)